MTDWIGDIFTSDTGWAHLEQLANLPSRMPGSKGERQAAERTRNILEEQGARDVRIETYGIQGWKRDHSAITHPDNGRSYQSFALPRSPSATAGGTFVDLGHGMPKDFETTDIDGCVAMVTMGVPEEADRYVHRNEKYYYAVQEGASAFVFRNTVNGDLAATGSVGIGETTIGEIPAVGVSKETGLRIARQHEGGDLAVTVEAESRATESCNVHAEIGPDTDEQLVLSCHIDAHDIAEGATDNGGSTAALVEAAGALRAREDELDTRVHLIGFGSEEINLVGSEYGADRIDQETVKAAVNTDGLAQSRTLQCHTHGFDGIETAITAVGERFGHPIETDGTLVPFSDHWPFVKHGTPGCLLTSETEGTLRGWGHTAGDTLDKIDRRDLIEQTVLLTEFVVELADDEHTIERKSPATMAETLEAEGQAEGMKVIGMWPYDDLGIDD
ncbi:MAG: M28 family peptidase [Halobacteriales archaeon]